jgi:septal ring factor EnvC (AmiA/AmiB activator)
LSALVAVFFLAAGAFGALWFVERGDHKTTQGQLTSARAETDDTRSQLQAAQKRANDADGLNSDLSIKRARLQQDLDDANRKLEELAKEPTPCADAGRALAKAVRANDQKAGEDAGVKIFLNCK